MRPATLRTGATEPVEHTRLLIALWGDSSTTPTRLASLSGNAFSGVLGTISQGHCEETAGGSHQGAVNHAALSVIELTAQSACKEEALHLASACDVALVVVDANTGIGAEARSCLYLSNLFAIPHLIVAVDGLDRVAAADAAQARVATELAQFAASFGFQSVAVVPVAPRSVGFAGGIDLAGVSMLSTLDGAIEAARVAVTTREVGFRLPIARNGPAGVVTTGQVHVGEEVVSALTGHRSRIVSIMSDNHPVESARAGDDVTLVLDDETTVSRGDALTRVTQRPDVADQFAAHVIWLGHEHLLPGRAYLLRIGTQEVGASVTAIKHRVDVATQQHLAARNLEAGEVGVCNFATAVPVVFDAFAENRKTGAFTLVDRTTMKVVAVGMIIFGLRRATNIHVEHLIVDKDSRSAAKKQKPTVIWFTGLSGSGKSTIAKHLEQRLHELGNHTYVLDGDNVRHGLNRDLGFTDTDRVENIRRIGEVAKLFVDAGLIVVCSFISPFRAERRMVRELLQEGEFVEVYVDASLAECQRRDPKGLYAKALAGKVKNFTGIDSPYEPPESAEVHLRTEGTDVEMLVDELLAHLRLVGRV